MEITNSQHISSKNMLRITAAQNAVGTAGNINGTSTTNCVCNASSTSNTNSANTTNGVGSVSSVAGVNNASNVNNASDVNNAVGANNVPGTNNISRKDSFLFFKKKEGGFTTAGTAIALLLVFSLLAVSLQAYWTGSRSGNIQYVADAGALAADEAVAQFVVAGQVVDAVLLSMSLLAITVYAVSAVAALIPGGQGVSGQLVSLGGNILTVRKNFGQGATKGLNALQKALPAICAVKSGQVISANADASGLDYCGVALAVPINADEITFGSAEEIEKSGQEISQDNEDISDKTEQDEEARKKISEAKERAWRADCGADGANMQERASTLAGLSGSENPKVSNPESWEFSLALSRAKKYYSARYNQEPAENYSGSPEEIAESVARKRFYKYALDTVSKGSVQKDEQGNELPSFEFLARNTQEIRSTYLYTESIYPTSTKDGKRTLHAYTGCPTYQKESTSGSASVAGIDSGSLHVCSECKMRPLTLGRVPSASTSIDNGFEYHYKALVEAANDYKAAQEERQELQKDLQDLGQRVKESLSKALKSIAGGRYDPQPPGRYGCVCIVSASKATVPHLSNFSTGENSLGVRVAISAATLAPDEGEDADSVINDVAAGMLPSDSAASGITKMLLGGWSKLLKVYTKGTEGIVDGFNTVLGGIPVIGDSLSSWAADTFRTAIKEAGLEPADLTTYKPVLVNTSQVLARSDGKVASVLLSLKQAAEKLGNVQIEGMSAVLDELPTLDDVGEYLSKDGFEIVKLGIELLGMSGEGGKLNFPIPENFEQLYDELLAQVKGKLLG